MFSYLDRTVSPGGRRLLKNWVCAPLMDVDRINDRLDSLEDINKIPEDRDKFREGLKKLPDLERICSR